MKGVLDRALVVIACTIRNATQDVMFVYATVVMTRPAIFQRGHIIGRAQTLTSNSAETNMHHAKR